MGPLGPSGPGGKGGFGRTGGGGGGGNWSWLWGGVVGAVFVALVGTVALYATGTFGGGKSEADLAGYHFHGNVCEASDLDAFGDHYDSDDSSDGQHQNTRKDALDVSSCSQRLRDTMSVSTAQLSTAVEWHKEADPEPEFSARQGAYAEHRSSDFENSLKPVKGIGDEAYLLTWRSAESSELSSMTLTVRDGWVTYEMTWSQTGGESTDTPSESEVSDWLKQDTKSVLANLKEPEGSGGGSEDGKPESDDEDPGQDDPDTVPDPPEQDPSEEDPGDAPGLDDV